MRGKVVLKELSTGIAATLLFFAIVQSLLQAAYFIGNSMVTEIPLPYAIGHSYGPSPPWIDGLRILEPDETLIWKNRSNLHRRYMDIFSPVQTGEERMSFPRQFLLPPIR